MSRARFYTATLAALTIAFAVYLDDLTGVIGAAGIFIGVMVFHSDRQTGMIQYIQNIHTPEALDANEVHEQTKKLLEEHNGRDGK